MFLAREITRSQNYSEETAKKIDEAIRSIIKEQYERAKVIIEENHGALRLIADALLEYETIEAVHVHEALWDGKITSEFASNDLSRKQRDKEEEEAAKKDSKTEEKKPEIGPSGDPAGAIA